MGAFDYLCVPLTCPRCAAHLAGEQSLDLECQTKVRARPDGSDLRLGMRHELLVDLGDQYSPTIEEPQKSPVRVIDEWVCPMCSLNYLWVKAVWVDGVLTHARAVHLTELELRDCDFITNMCTDIVEGDERTPNELTNLPPAEFRAVLAHAETARWSRIRAEDAAAVRHTLTDLAEAHWDATWLELPERLGLKGARPIDLQRRLKADAIAAGSGAHYLAGALVRELLEAYPSGWKANDDWGAIKATSHWTSDLGEWASGPGTEVLLRLRERHPDGWRPAGPQDPLVVGAIQDARFPVDRLR